ncbi:hypothetical protein [Nocardioides sediminis]|uniref:hypothetical protein n=1 Tax=Nocardioides sediminis TaxID=433648 RepID=UPI000D30E163|nr:hypothetical protein [Nocardioides sediminis]
MRVPTRPGRTAAFLLLVATALPGLAACAGEAEAETVPAGAGSRAEVRSALVSLYAANAAGDDSGDDRDAECFADGVLERVTPAQLRDGGVLDASYEPRAEIATLDRTVAEAWTAAQMSCTDFVEESTRAQEALTKGRLDADAYATCLEGRLDEATIHDASVSTLMARWDDPAVGEMSVAQSECSVLSVPRD